MASSTQTPDAQILRFHSAPAQWRYTLAALVYFGYGLVYLFGAHYLTNMQMSERAMPNSQGYFIIGAVLVLLLPWLIYRRFALACAWYSPRYGHQTTVGLDFTLLLGCLVSARVVALVWGQSYLKTPLHTVACVVALLTATCLLWAGFSRPWWSRRDTLSVPPRP